MTVTVAAMVRAPKCQKGVREEAIEAGESSLIIEDDNDDECSELVLMYNTVQGYISAVKEL